MPVLQPDIRGARMTDRALARDLPRAASIGAPSKDGLRLIFAGMAYLLVICAVQAVVLFRVLGVGVPRVPGDAVEVRDVVALFGWVGLMISGVGVIIVPNHLKVHVRPSILPRLHLVLANVGLAGYFASSIAVPDSMIPGALLGLTSTSFFIFGAGFLATIYPFVRHPIQGSPTGSRARTPADASL